MINLSRWDFFTNLDSVLKLQSHLIFYSISYRRSLSPNSPGSSREASEAFPYHRLDVLNISQDDAIELMRTITQFGYFKIQRKTIDEASGNKPHKLYSLFPGASCSGLLFNAEF